VATATVSHRGKGKAKKEKKPGAQKKPATVCRYRLKFGELHEVAQLFILRAQLHEVA
jgi:hypothetical protein